MVLRVLRPIVFLAAAVWRRLLRRTFFIAITGSLGKTTAKECLAAVLSTQARTFGSVGTQNAGRLLSLNLLRVRPWHRFAVIELGTRSPGELARSSMQVRPDLAIVLGVAPTHTRNYASLDEIAAEKMQILRGLRPGGSVILNGDDPHLRGVPIPTHCRVARFGNSPDTSLRAESIASDWPGRLTFRAVAEDTAAQVRTRLLGTHWVPSILATLLAARHCGIDLTEAADAIGTVPPSRGRLEPVELPNGAVIVRDEYNASPYSYEAALAVLQQARNQRRIAVLGDMTDNKDKVKRRLRKLGRRVATLCDVAVFVGPNAHHARAGAIAAGMPESAVLCSPHAAAASAVLQRELRAGDVVLVKGWTSLHLERLTFAQVGTVGCWMPNCLKRIQCDVCWKLSLTSRELATLRPFDGSSLSAASIECVDTPVPRAPAEKPQAGSR